MFLDYAIVKEFSMSKTKCAYVIKFVLAPIFKNDLVEQINSSLSLLFSSIWREFKFIIAAMSNGHKY